MEEPYCTFTVLLPLGPPPPYFAYAPAHARARSAWKILQLTLYQTASSASFSSPMHPANFNWFCSHCYQFWLAKEAEERSKQRSWMWAFGSIHSTHSFIGCRTDRFAGRACIVLEYLLEPRANVHMCRVCVEFAQFAVLNSEYGFYGYQFRLWALYTWMLG